MATHALSQDISGWSDNTVCRLAKATPDNVEYQAESTKRGLSCGGSNKKSSSALSPKVAKALAGIDIENDPSLAFFKPPMAPYPTNMNYWFGRQWRIADFNNDGYSDIIYIGTIKPNNIIDIKNNKMEVSGRWCPNNNDCTGTYREPALFLGDADGNLTYSSWLLVDNREIPGLEGPNQILIADYNNDGVMDIYFADTGVGNVDGQVNSYFLSQPDGTWLESSDTHLSHSSFVVWDHGAATGDIDNDGDMDVVITEIHSRQNRTAFWCLMNDGTGYLKKRKCGGADSYGLELADMDGDGDLDALVGAEENTRHHVPFTGIVWNDGKGRFSLKTKLPEHKKKYSGIPEISASDLDNDGDLDIVVSRVGEYYVGTAIQIIENLGNKKFKDHGLIELLIAPDDFKTKSEANIWNSYIDSIVFRDLDNDGDMDVYLAGQHKQSNGSILINQGSFVFDLIRPVDTHKFVTDRTDSKIKFSYKKHIPTDEEQSVEDELAEFEASLENEPAGFDAAIAKRKAKVAAAKAKRIAEETAKAAETDTVDTGQSVDDELAAFEAELAAELAE